MDISRWPTDYEPLSWRTIFAPYWHHRKYRETIDFGVYLFGRGYLFNLDYS